MVTYPSTFNKSFNQNNYNYDMKHIDLSKLRCSCGSCGPFKHHATYSRYVILDSRKEPIFLSIQRIRCLSCLKTHALLPVFIIPYRIFSMPIIHRVIYLFRISKLSAPSIAKSLNLNLSYVQYLISFYLKHHHQRLLSLSLICPPISFSFSFISTFHNAYRIFFMQRPSSTHHLLFMDT